MKRSLSNWLNLLIVGIAATNYAHATDELPTIHIGFLDVVADVRYDDWGIHPVDIRSATAIVDRRAYAGAQLAIKELEQFTRIAKANFSLERHSLKDATEMVQTLLKMREEGSHFFLLDAPDSPVSP